MSEQSPEESTQEQPDEQQPARLPVADSEFDYFKKEADRSNMETRGDEVDGT